MGLFVGVDARPLPHSDDGSSLALRGRWTIFTSPLARIIPLREEKVGQLRDHVLCVSENGTIAIVSLSEGIEW